MQSKNNSYSNDSVVLSAFLVVKNEEKNLPRCLEHLGFCDEIVLVDQHSTDNTVKIAKKYGCKVYYDKQWGYCEPSRVLAASKCRGKWILNLDADEIVSEDLKAEILEIISSDKHDVVYLKRYFYYFGKRLKYVGQDDSLLRLHKRGIVIYTPEIHNGVHPKKNALIYHSKYGIEHYAINSFSQHLGKLNRYAEIQARTDPKFQKFPRKYLGIFYTPIFYFFYYYFWHLGILDKTQGLIWSLVMSYYQILIYKYLWFKS